MIEPINTQEYYSAEGCFAVYEFGNYDGVAFGKSEVADVSGSGCEIADYIVAYKNGSYAYGYSAAALAGEGWTNPQAQVTGYSVLSEYVEVCSKKGSTLACQLNEFDAL